MTPSWDLRTLWVDSDKGNTLTPIDPQTGRAGQAAPCGRPVQPLLHARRAPRDRRGRAAPAAGLPRSAHAAPQALDAGACPGIDHMDFTADGRRALASCEFSRQARRARRRGASGSALRAAARAARCPRTCGWPGRSLVLRRRHGQRRRLAGQRATMRRPGSSRPAPARTGFVLSRDARRLYISNRGEGTISVLDLATNQLVARWRIPGGGSPDMGGVSAERHACCGCPGRWNSEVYAISHAHRPAAAPHPGRARAARAVGLAAARALLAGAHRYVALSAGR